MTVCAGLIPADRDHGLIWVVEPWIIPASRDAMPCRPQETGVLPVGDWILGDGKGAHPHPVHRLFIVSTGLAPHQKVPGWDGHQLGLDGARRVMRTEC
jgi:hypothetical protein